MPLKLSDFTNAVFASSQAQKSSDANAPDDGVKALFIGQDGKPIVRTVSVTNPDSNQKMSNFLVRKALYDALRDEGYPDLKELESKLLTMAPSDKGPVGGTELTLSDFNSVMIGAKDVLVQNNILTGAKIVLDGAAMAATRLITKEEVNACFTTDDERRAYANTVNNAIDGLAAAYKLSGEEIKGKTGELMTTVGYLSDLAGKLMDAYGSAPKGTGQRAKIEKMADYCSARASELTTLCTEAEAKSEAGAPTKDLASRTVRGLVADKAKTMHGAKEFVKNLETQTEELSKQVADLILACDAASLRSRDYQAKIEALHTEIVAMIDTLGKQAQSAPPEEVTLMDALKAELQRLKDQLAILSDSVENLVKQVKAQLILDAVSYPKTSPKPEVDTVIQKFDEAIKKNSCGDMFTFFKITEQDKKDLAIYALSHVYSHIKALEENVKKCTITPQQLKMVLVGRISAKHLLDIKAQGFRDKDVDWSLMNDQDAVSGESLGSGAFNTVISASHTIRKDGVNEEETIEYAFKGEHVATGGLLNSPAGKSGAYDTTNRAYRTNLASYAAARFLKAESVIVKSSLGVHAGSVGIFMEKAKGMSLKQLGYNARNGKPIPEDLLDITDDETAKGRLKRELNRLAWVDWLTGQIDRNAGNYLIHADGDNVTVAGIDNDLSFPDFRIGLRKLRLSLKSAKRIYKKLFGSEPDEGATIAALVDRINGEIKEKCKSENHKRGISDDNLIKRVGDGQVRYEIDPGSSPFLKELFSGVFGILGSVREKPSVIAKSTYDRLMAVNADVNSEKTTLAAEVRKFMGRGFTKRQHAAAESRLDEMIKHAIHLGTSNPSKVIDDDDLDAWAASHESGYYKNDVKPKFKDVRISLIKA